MGEEHTQREIAPGFSRDHPDDYDPAKRHPNSALKAEAVSGEFPPQLHKCHTYDGGCGQEGCCRA